jgi:hypothetical protein
MHRLLLGPLYNTEKKGRDYFEAASDLLRLMTSKKSTDPLLWRLRADLCELDPQGSSIILYFTA